jgi:uncharacterized membrane protein YoaK (UPF0700 family)
VVPVAALTDPNWSRDRRMIPVKVHQPALLGERTRAGRPRRAVSGTPYPGTRCRSVTMLRPSLAGNDVGRCAESTRDVASRTVAFASRWALETRRDVLLVLLTVATGSVDAVGFLRLGGVFTSVMTANMVLLGVSAGKHDAALALHSGAAFGGYIIGAVVGSRIAGHPTDGQPVWPRRVTTALAVELASLVLFTACWEATDGHPSGATTYPLLAVNAASLGIQSGAVLRLGVSGLSTTYLTGTLTQFVSSLSRGAQRSSWRSSALLPALIVGGAIGAALAIYEPPFLPMLPLCIVVFVLACSYLAFPDR